MKNFNLTQMLQGCSRSNEMTVSASNSGGGQTCQVKQQTRLTSVKERWSEKEALSSTCLRSASDALSFRSRYLRYAAMIFCVLAMSMANVGMAWADQSVGSVYAKFDFNGSEENFEYWSSDNRDNPVWDLGELTSGDFKFKEVYWKCSSNWTPLCNAKGYYKINGGSDQLLAEFVDYGGKNGSYEIQNTGVNKVIASYNSPSGVFECNHYFYVNFKNTGDGWNTTVYVSNNSKNYTFKYTILPPAVSSFTVTPTGAISGSGTSGDPYIVPYGGDLKLTMSGSQGHSDANSSAKYYNTSNASAWTTQTYKTISNVTNTASNNSVTIKMCYENTSHSELHGTESEATIYYKAAKYVAMYKFVVSGSVSDGNVCAATGTNYSQTVAGGQLSSLIGGTLTASTGSATQLKFTSHAYNFNGGTNGLLTIILENPIKTGDVIRFINSAASGNKVYFCHTSKGNSTDRQELDGNGKNEYQTIVLPSGFNGKNTIYLSRGAGTTALSSLEILRNPYKVTLDANTNGGEVNGNNSENHYLTTGETLLLPHATKASNRFKGWFTTAGGSAEASNPYTPSSETTTLYAQFDECTSSGTVYKFQVKDGLANNTKTEGDLNVGNFLSTLDGGTAVMTGTHAKIVNNNEISFANNGDYITVDLDCALQTGDTIITTISGSKSGIKITSTSSTTSLQNISYGTKVKTIVPSGLNNYKTFRLYEQDTNCGGLSYFEIKRPAKYTITHDISNVTKTSGETEVIHKSDYTAVYAAAAGYELPDAVTVMRGVTNITAYCNWTSGTLSIPGAQVTGNITITVAGVTPACTTPTASWATAPANGNVGGNMNATLTTNYATGVVYTSSNTDVATVSGDGTTTCTINYVAAGTARITATVTGDGATICTGPATCYTDITVSRNTPTAYAVTGTAAICSGGNTNITLANSQTGASYQLKKGGVAEGVAKVGTGEALTWSVSAAGTYTVSAVQTTKYSARDMTGNAVITFKTNTAIETQPTSIAKANVGAEQTLSVVATGSNLEYQWYSCSDAEKTGATELTGEKGYELSVTPAAVGVIYYYCVVSGDCGDDVTSNVVSITAKNAISPTLSYDSYSVLIGGTLTATLDKKGSDGSVTYESSDDAVATVASDGTVTGVSAGTVTITATIADGTSHWGNTATSSTITVSAPTYTVTYTTTGSTGGTAPTDSNSPYESGSTVTVLGNTGSLAKTSNVFLGWSDGSGNNYAPGETFTISENTTLSPIWKEGTSATVTYTMAVGTSNTWSASGSSNETTGIPNAGVTITETYAGIDNGTGHKNGSTAKLAIQTTAQGATYDSPTNYILYNFSVASGYAFTPSDITIKIANVGEKSANNIKYKAVLSDASSHSISTTYICTTQDATIETFHLYNEDGVTFDGNVSLKLWAWKISSTANGSSDSGKTGSAYRLGTPLTIAGVTESTATLYDISTSATNGTIAVTVGGESASSAEEDATVHIEATPSDGYSFSSWTVTKDAGGDVDLTSSTTSPTTFSMPGEDVTVSATFSPNTYDITYHENGASYKAGYTAPATYTVGTGATLPTSSNMTNTGYTFGGWYDNSGLTGSSVTTIGTSEYGIKEYWAKWTENTYTITYDANGGTGTTSSTNGHYVTVATNGFTAPSGKVFVGWNTVSGGGGDSYGEGDEIELTGNMTLYAIWATDYDISWGNAQYGGADETPNLGGGNYTITASVATWTGTLTTDMISAVSDGVTITNVAVVNSASPKTITATFDVGASVAGTTIKMQLDVPAYGVFGAKSSEKSITIDRCSGGGGASTVVFSQNFSSDGAGSVAYAANTAREYKSGGTTITGIVGSGANEFTYIGQVQKSNAGVAVNSSTGGNSVNATGIFQAYCNNTGGKYALVKNSNFAATAPTALKVSMKIWFQQGSSSTDYSVTFAVGDGFSNSTSAPDATNVHSGFSIINNSNAYLYAYKSNKTVLSGTNKLTQGSDLTMVWVINNSGQTLSYTDPASNTSTLANDKFDVWIGTTRFIAGANATTASKALQDLYIGDPAGKNHQLRLDDIVVTDISPAVSSITPTLTWDDGALDIASDGVTKEEGDADFTFTASQNKNSLGAITYSSSNTSVATVNASGKVHIVGNGSTTITASIAESGCYKDADVSYSLTVNEEACADAAGAIKDNDGNTIDGNAITKSSCETVTLKLVGYTDDADIQWYKDGEEIVGATAASYTVPTSGSGVYSAISSKTCDRNSTNEITVTNSASVSATKIVDSWYVKAGRRTPDIALVKTMDAASFQVKISSTVIWSTVSGSEVTTGLGGCGFYLGKDGIIYLKGTKNNGNATDDILENKTLSFVVTNACGTNASDPGNITIKRQAATDRPSVAYVSLGAKNGAVTDTTAGCYKTAALYKYLDYTLSGGDFDLTARNVYWSVNEKELKEHYSQFDAILITDDPSTKTVPSGVSGDGAYKTKGYVNALGCLVDIRPILTMEAYVSALANWKTKGINGDPTSPNPRQYSMKLQCKDHEIFGSLSVGDNVVQTTVDGTNYWSVKMVDNTKSPYSGLADDEKTSGKGSIPALQGFAASDVSGLLLLGQISDGAYHAGVERQEEPAARLMLLGLNNQALPNALTQEGKIVIKNALTYLLKTNMEEIDDCSNYFTGATSTDWNTATNWSKGVVPNSPMIRARILAPCEITGITVKAAQIDIVTSGTSSKKAGELTGKLTINPTGALIVGGKIRAAEAPYFSIEDLKPTEEEDLVLNTNSSNQAALVFNNEDGDTKATVNLYSLGRKEGGAYQFQYYAVPMDYVSVSESFAGSDIYTYVWHEATGWERRGYYTDLYAFEGVGITTKLAAPKTYTMKGALASTATKEITLTIDDDGYNLIGNSWTAPIQISQLEEDNSSLSNQTVYIYNAGNDTTAADGTGTGAGQWQAIPFDASGFSGWSGMKVIPAMQAFELVPTSEETLTLDYDKVVRGDNKSLTEPLHAPRRVADHAGIELMRIRVADSKTHTDLHLFEGERFSDEFDNGWEAAYMDGDDGTTKLYADVALGRMAVVATDVLEGTLLGFAPGKETEYTFTFGGEGMGYYLNDLKLKTSTLISEEATYSFTYEEGDTNRFYISRTPIDAPQTPTGVENTHSGTVKAHKFIYNDKLYIMLNGRVYSAEGQIVK